MNAGFTSISLHDYGEVHLSSNPGAKRAKVIARLEDAIDAFRKDIRCQCGTPIWIIGCAQAGLARFTCITGEAIPDHDYEIEVKAAKPPAKHER